MKILKNIFLDPYDGGLRGRWYLLAAAIGAYKKLTPRPYQP